MKILDQSGRLEILARIDRLEQGLAARWGRMTVAQMICHLSDSYLVLLGARASQPRITWNSRYFLRWAALRLPVAWPQGVPTLPESDQMIGGTRPSGDFAADKARLVALVNRFSPGTPGVRFAPHPVFGPLSDWELLRWGYLHADHHLRQFGQ